MFEAHKLLLQDPVEATYHRPMSRQQLCAGLHPGLTLIVNPRHNQASSNRTGAQRSHPPRAFTIECFILSFQVPLRLNGLGSMLAEGWFIRASPWPPPCLSGAGRPLPVFRGATGHRELSRSAASGSPRGLGGVAGLSFPRKHLTS